MEPAMETSTARRKEMLDLVRAAAWILCLGGIIFALDAILENYQLASLLFGVFAIDLLMRGRGLSWDETGQRTILRSLRTVVAGLLLGSFALLLAVGVCWAVGLAEVTFGRPTAMGFGLGLVTPLAQAARDELLFRGAPLALLRNKISDRFTLPFVALLGGAPVLLQSNASWLGIGVVVVSGWIFALAVRAGRGLLLAWGAHAGWLFMLGAGSRGEVLDVRIGDGLWYPLMFAEGKAAWVVFGIVVVVAVVVSVLYASRRVPRNCDGPPSTVNFEPRDQSPIT